jgi:diguanylate cyclase (GGDEF)-like protein/PAS domain S-box-containing protein
VELRDRARAEQLYRLLADNSEDAIVCGDVFGRCRYTSPSLSIITTHSAEALRGWGWVDLVVEADRPKVITALTDLQSGASQASARYRYARADGAVTWVEMRARLTQLVPGISQREFVANIRDITRQKQAEEELEEANAELSALSMTDALTGVANRRQFDQMLRKEWNRAMRTASPLSLLMIDADHFKAYNDLYGHPMGDQCLRQVAQAVARSVLRAGDVVARYGGEEFAVILPDTIAEMAAQVGDRVIAALALDAVPHQGNARGIVTVSIGVASMIPELGSTSAELMSQADAALYQAKHAGRATIVIAPPSVTPPLPIPGQRNAA